MRLARGDMFKSRSHIVIVTGNATLRADGSLVMGRGAAYQATQLHPGCDKKFGTNLRLSRCSIVKPHMVGCNLPNAYGLTFIPAKMGRRMGVLAVFQVKWHFKDPARLDLITFSTDCLHHAALNTWANYSISMNFPGIGNGGLKREEVLPIIEKLPNNITIWEY